VRLIENITDCDCTCINFNDSDSIIFDGMGHTIHGTRERSSNGVYLPAYSNMNTIKNLSITDFHNGIFLFTASYNTIENITAYHNRDTGITILYGKNTVRDCSLHENTYSDFYFRPHYTQDYESEVVNVTGSGGRDIGLYHADADIRDKEFAALYLCDADNATVSNVSIIGSSAYNNNGMRVYKTDNAVITGVTSSDNHYGISIEDSSNSTLINSTFEDNQHYNIYMSYGSDNTLQNVVTKGSRQAGIYLYHSTNAVMSKILADQNPFGIKLDNSPDNVINDSMIINNHIVGISAAGTGSIGNLIYNNYFANAANAWDGGGNIWNITETTGQNIIDGSRIGGNYWSDYNGTDEDGDGFGEAPYNLSIGIDYLPLVYRGICGDVDQNGYVSANDVVEAYRNAVDPNYPIGSEWAADVDGNGYISANDVVEIYRNAVDPNHVLNCKA